MPRTATFFALSLALALGCNERSSSPLRAVADPAPPVVAASSPDAGPLDASIAEASDANLSEPDACSPGEVWEARVVVTQVKQPIPMQGSLELVVPRLGKRVVVYRNCGATGGGCGDCTKPAWDGISCTMDASHAHVDVGIDEVGPTYVDVRQRGDAIVADWTWGKFQDDWADPVEGTHETKVLLRLPCEGKVRFVR